MAYVRSERPPTRTQALLAGAPGWVGGVLTGVQAAVLGILVVITPAFAAVAAAPTTNGSATIDWMGVTTLSVRLWLLAHGVPFFINDTEFTTALFPKDGRYLLPLKDKVREATGIDVDEDVSVELRVGRR